MSSLSTTESIASAISTTAGAVHEYISSYFGDYTTHIFDYGYWLPGQTRTTIKQLTGWMDDLQPGQDEEHKAVLFISFNQDSSYVGVGHEDGYSFYDVRSVDKLLKIDEGKVPDRVCLIERLYMSSLVAAVSLRSTRRLQVYHSQRASEICCQTYASAILTVRMNRKRVVVCLEDSIYIHNIRDMRLLHTIDETPLNPLGVMDLSNDDEACYIAFPAASTTGHVHLFDADGLKAVCQFSAHSGPLAALRFSSDGRMLATGSDKGTVIRVFSVPEGDRLFEFTRGVKRCVQINSLAFSNDSRYLCLSSNTETVHIFALSRNNSHLDPMSSVVPSIGGPGGGGIGSTGGDTSPVGAFGSWMNYLSQQATAYLPTHMNELMLREKSTTTARLPITGHRTAVAIQRVSGGEDYLLVASTAGYLFCYSIPTDGSECTLMRQYRVGPGDGGGIAACSTAGSSPVLSSPSGAPSTSIPLASSAFNGNTSNASNCTNTTGGGCVSSNAGINSGVAASGQSVSNIKATLLPLPAPGGATTTGLGDAFCATAAAISGAAGSITFAPTVSGVGNNGKSGAPVGASLSEPPLLDPSNLAAFPPLGSTPSKATIPLQPATSTTGSKSSSGITATNKTNTSVYNSDSTNKS